MRLYGDKRTGAHFNASGVVIVSYSGGYVSTAYALATGGAAHRIKGVILIDRFMATRRSSPPGPRHDASSPSF